MNKLHWIFNRFAAPEGDDGSSNGGAPAPAPETNDGESGVDWEALSDGVEQGADEGGGNDEVVLDDSQPPPGALSTDPEEAPKPDATTQEAKPTEPVTPVQPSVAKTPEQEAAESEALATRFKEWQQSETERLTKEYAFDDDTAARLQTEPELVLPQLAAKMHLQVMQQVVETVQRLMPSMVQPVLQSTSREAEATTFFSTHNSDIDLKDPKQSEAVLEAGKAFRKMNPTATPEQAAIAIGQIVRTAMGKPAPPPAPKQKTVPHRPPAAGSRGPASPAKAGEPTKWDTLLEDD